MVSVARPNSRCRDDTLANSPSFLEAEISLPTVHRLTDDDVVKHLDLKNPGSFAKPTREAEISFARARVSGGVVVYQDERVCRMGNNRAEYIPRIRQRLIKSALGNISHRDQSLARIK